MQKKDDLKKELHDIVDSQIRDDSTVVLMITHADDPEIYTYTKGPTPTILTCLTQEIIDILRKMGCSYKQIKEMLVGVTATHERAVIQGASLLKRYNFTNTNKD